MFTINSPAILFDWYKLTIKLSYTYVRLGLIFTTWRNIVLTNPFAGIRIAFEKEDEDSIGIM